MSTYVDATSGAVEHCETMANLHADLAESYKQMANLCRQKLWHQLTLTILPFVSDASNLRTTPEGTNSFLALYDKVVGCVDKKLNALSLARIASAVSDSLAPADGTAAKAVLENLLTHKDRLGVPATLFAESKLNLLSLNILEQRGGALALEDNKAQLSSIQTALQANASKLQEMAVDTSTTIVHSAHYECAMKYRKAVGPPEAFFQEALSYLNYSPLTDMESPHQLAMDLSLAALTGDGVFNFGQVVTTPILSALENTPEAWLMEFMHCMANGDIISFQNLSEKYAAQIQSQPALVHRAATVKEKITLLALVTMIFERPAAERTLSFQQIADRVLVPLDQVEWVIMRALSLKLIKGSMDQVSQLVHITWVIPRVLTDDQLQELAGRFGEWAVKVSKTADYIGEHTPALFT
jgi:26S proteasome regulatory subunit N9